MRAKHQERPGLSRLDVLSMLLKIANFAAKRYFDKRSKQRTLYKAENPASNANLSPDEIRDRAIVTAKLLGKGVEEHSPRYKQAFMPVFILIRWKLISLRKLTLLSDEAKDELYFSVMDATIEKEFARFEASNFVLKLTRPYFQVCGIAALVVAGNTLHHQFASIVHPSLLFILSYDLLSFGFGLFCLLITWFIGSILFSWLPAFLLPDDLSRNAGWWSKLHLVSFLVCLAASYALSYPFGPQHYLLASPQFKYYTWKPLLISGIVSALWIWIIIPLWLVLCGPVYPLHIWALNRRSPRNVIIAGLFELLCKTETNPLSWNDLPFKRELMSNLEAIAHCVEKYLPRALSSSDPVSNYRIDQWTKEKAANLRALKLWIAVPMADTREAFMIYLANNLISATRGDWDRFARSDSENENPEEAAKMAKTARNRYWQSRIVDAFRAILVAALPALVLWLMRRPPLHLIMPTYANVAVVIWAVITLLVEIDPGFAAKAEAVKSIKEAFSGGKEK